MVGGADPERELKRTLRTAGLSDNDQRRRLARAILSVSVLRGRLRYIHRRGQVGLNDTDRAAEESPGVGEVEELIVLDLIDR